MKPCAKNKKRIAWLVLDASDAQAAQDLRAHLAVCEGCRGYLRELAQLTDTLCAAEGRTGLQASESFHRRVTSAIRAGQSRPLWEAVAEYFQGIARNWRVALPAFGAIAVVIVGLVASLRHPSVPAPAPSPARTRLAANLGSNLAPTVANYHLAANRSLEELDDLLTRQASRRSAPVPIFTASTLALAKNPD